MPAAGLPARDGNNHRPWSTPHGLVIHHAAGAIRGYALKDMPWSEVCPVYSPITQSLDELYKIVPLSSNQHPFAIGIGQAVQGDDDRLKKWIGRQVSSTHQHTLAGFPDGSYTAARNERRAANATQGRWQGVHLDREDHSKPG